MVHEHLDYVPRMTFQAPRLRDEVEPKESSGNPAMERFSLANKTAIITGGSGDLGFSSARALAQHGVTKISLWDVSDPHGQSAVGKLKEEFPKISVVFQKVDISDYALVHAGIDEFIKTYGTSPDILLNFAGIVDSCHALDLTPARIQRMLSVNTIGAFNCAQAVAKSAIAQKKPASIVLVASVSGHSVNFPQPQVFYNASKASVLSMTKSLAAEWAVHNIRVNSISPGYMDSILNEGDALEDLRKQWLSRTPMGRLGTREELSGAVILLCSKAASFMTGTDIIIDGGLDLTF